MLGRLEDSHRLENTAVSGEQAPLGTGGPISPGQVSSPPCVPSTVRAADVGGCCVPGQLSDISLYQLFDLGRGTRPFCASVSHPQNEGPLLGGCGMRRVRSRDLLGAVPGV